MRKSGYVRGLQGANLDLGMTALRFAGLEATESLTGPVVRTRSATGQDQGQFFFLSPSTVTESINNLDASVKALDADIAGNVHRQPFLVAWQAWKDAWTGFKNDNDSTIKLLLHGTGPVWRQAETYRIQLQGWRDAYVKETAGLAPSGPVPPAPTPVAPPKEPFWTPTKIALGVLIAGALGFATYRYWQSARKTEKRLRTAAEAYVGRRLTGGAGRTKMLGEGD
jgi:hypothetical protein